MSDCPYQVLYVSHFDNCIFQGKYPAYLNTKRQSSKDQGTGILLDPNHTHFILVDNGTTDKFGAEIDLRARLERGISTQKMDSETRKYNISFT